MSEAREHLNTHKEVISCSLMSLYEIQMKLIPSSASGAWPRNNYCFSPIMASETTTSPGGSKRRPRIYYMEVTIQITSQLLLMGNLMFMNTDTQADPKSSV